MSASHLLPRFEIALEAARGSLLGALRRLVWRRVAMLWLAHYFLMALQVASPLLIVSMIRFLGDSSAPLWVGLLIALGGFVHANLQAQASAFIHRNAIGKGAELRLQAMLALFQKALRLRAFGSGEGIVSSLIASMSVDCERIYFLMHMGSWINFQTVLYVVIVVVLCLAVGFAAGLAGALTLLVLMLLTAKIAQALMLFRRRTQEHSSRRLLLTRQVLDGIRAIKMYGWVEPVERRIAISRAAEERELARYLMLRALSTTIAFIVPSAVTFTILAVAALLGSTPTVEGVFVVVALVNVLRGPMSGFPVVVGYLTDGLVSVKRVENLLQLPEADQDESSSESVHQGEKAPVVELQDAAFAWHDVQQATSGLRNLNLCLGSGELCCVVGPVGSGKTSLLSAVLGHMAIVSGTRSLRSPSGVAYCPQEPWILSAEIWRNIAAGCDARSEVDEAAYARAVSSAQLLADFAQFPAGDSTEIGAHGINLSGGQRARVALARAIYQSEVGGCELVVLDDVLSAVDCAVARELMACCILGESLSRRARLVVLNSHYELLESADRVVVVADGQAEVYDSAAAYKAASPWASSLAAAAAAAGGPAAGASSEAASPAVASKAPAPAAAVAPAVPGAAAPTPAATEVPAWIAAGLPEDFDLAPVAGDASADPRRRSGGSAAAAPLPAPPGGGGAAATAPPVESEELLDESGRLLVPEDRKVGLLSFSTYRLYFGRGACGCGSAFFFFVLGLIFAAEGMRIVCDLWIADWATAPVDASGEAEGGNAYWLSRYALLTASTFVICLVRSVVFMAFARRTSRNMHERMLARALRAPVNIYFDTVPTSQILNRLSKDLDVVDTMLPHYLLEFFQDWGFLLGTFAVVAWKAPPVLAVLPFCAFAFVRVRARYMATSRELKRLEATARSPLLATLSEALEGLASIRALRLGAAFERRFARQADDNGALFWHSFVLLPWMIGRIDGIGSVFVLATALSMVFLRASSAPVAGALAFTFIMNWTAKLQWAVRQSIEAENYLTSVERCEHFERIPQEAEPPPAGTAAAAAVPPAVPPAELLAAAEEGARPAVEFRNVSVRYRPRLPRALRGLSFSVRAGERVGVIGRTGCGKSTLTLCLFRLLEVEQDGEVRLHGFDIRRLSTTTLRRAIAAVPQTPLVYAGSLRENLDPLAELGDEPLWEALQRVGLTSFVKQGNGGLDLALAEGGANMSAGQRQLLTIARASLRRSRVVVCDEATSSCDPKTDAMVQQLLQGRDGEGGDGPFAGAAMLTIAHRLDTLATYDRVLLLGATAGGGLPTSVLEITRPSASGHEERLCSL